MSHARNTASTKKTDEQIQLEFDRASAAHAAMKARQFDERFEADRNRLPSDAQFVLVKAWLDRFPYVRGPISVADGRLLRAIRDYLKLRPDLWNADRPEPGLNRYRRPRDVLVVPLVDPKDSIDEKSTKRAQAKRRAKQ